MKFKMNNDKWEIKLISNDEMQKYADSDLKESFTHGLTVYNENTIYLNELSPNKKRTLHHELVHCYLYEFGFNPFEKQFSLEDVCEICASSNEIINKIINDYFNKEEELEVI